MRYRQELQSEVALPWPQRLRNFHAGDPSLAVSAVALVRELREFNGPSPLPAHLGFGDQGSTLFASSSKRRSALNNDATSRRASTR